MGDRSERLLGWRSGGWVLLLAVVLVVAAVVWRAAPLLSRGSGAIGDGRDPDTYGFDLSTSLVPRELIRASGFPRDGIPVLDGPPTMPANAVPALNEQHRGKYLVAADRVIGVVAGGEARAYPLRVLNWHEVVNDTLGGIPIAVTYNPLCDSVVVFDRRLGDETLRFGVSGLLFNSNLLLYDVREEPRAASLWSQLQARAVAGPAAQDARRLRVLPASVARWSHWIQRHPRTSVLSPDADRLKRYQRNPYGSYLASGKLRFPVLPLPPDEPLAPMSPVLVVETASGRVVYPLDPASLERLALTAMRQGVVIDFDESEEPPSVVVTARPGARTYYACWFAWYSQHPRTALAELTDAR